MKTIEERALESLRQVTLEKYNFHHSVHGDFTPPDTTYVGGYIQGANDQREIYREWLEKKCHEHPSMGTWEDIIEDFRKEMEEKE